MRATTGQRQSETGWLKEYRARRRAWSQAARQRQTEHEELLAALDRLEGPGMDEADLDAVRAIWWRLGELDTETARAVQV